MGPGPERRIAIATTTNRGMSPTIKIEDSVTSRARLTRETGLRAACHGPTSSRSRGGWPAWDPPSSAESGGNGWPAQTLASTLDAPRIGWFGPKSMRTPPSLSDRQGRTAQFQVLECPRQPHRRRAVVDEPADRLPLDVEDPHRDGTGTRGRKRQLCSRPNRIWRRDRLAILTHRRLEAHG